MKFATLKAIEELLQNDVKAKTQAVEMVTNELNGLYQDEADEAEDFDPENLKYWQDRKKRITDNLMKAEETLEDFLNHDWR